MFAEAAQWIVPPEAGPELIPVEGLDDAGEILENRLGGTEVVLLKASRGVAMESLVPGLEARFGPSTPASGDNPGGNLYEAAPSRDPVGKGA